MKSLVLVLSFCFSLSALFQAYAQQSENITITTYYPSPYGVYGRIATKTIGVGDMSDPANGIGSDDSPDPGTNPGDMWVAGNIGLGTTNPQTKLHISGTPGVDGIIFPDDTKQTSASLQCQRVDLGWQALFNHQTYSVSCPSGYQGVQCGFDFYDTNSGVLYHGYQPASWNSDRTTCSMTLNDDGISEGRVVAECCRMK